METTCKSFVEFLKNRGYSSDYISFQKKIQVRGISYSCVEILHSDKSRIIQSFVILTENQRLSYGKFPFYREYHQNAGYGNIINPSCSIAVLDESKNKWEIYNASDHKCKRTEDYISYENAIERFNARWEASPGIMLKKRLGKYSRACAISLIVYLVFHILSLNLGSSFLVIPLNQSISLILLTITILVVLPVLIPYIKSLSIFGVKMFLKE